MYYAVNVIHLDLINCDCVSSYAHCVLIKSACAFDKGGSNNIDAKWSQILFKAVNQGMCTQIAAIFSLHDAPKPIKRELSCALFENRPHYEGFMEIICERDNLSNY